MSAHIRGLLSVRIYGCLAIPNERERIAARFHYCLISFRIGCKGVFVRLYVPYIKVDGKKIYYGN